MEASKIITIPNHWTSPKYSLGQRTKQGMIVGVQYCLFENLVVPERDGSWRYAILVSAEDEQVEYISESGVQLPPEKELRLEIEGEIDFCQRKIQNLTQQLEAL
jgi:hypothetical protein